ncbi:MAG: HD domain-containing protein [Synechococcales cyanobacterium K44_A2020_017]|nr:HD domain-containing protein [Synechococcales cyanobacterium K32_A2020_035]MBF2095963.1 HD domain-containing protein [Synechococcales cyanobacterium K44_A2020_017]
MPSWPTLPNLSRTYHDPLHGAIALDRSDPVEWLLIQLIDTPALQRLRRIRQLGPASLTFHGAESSRFTHSLGVMAIARRAFDHLANRYHELRPHRAAVLCAALLHDVGHGPFSHTSEEIFGCHHEAWTMRILNESPSVRHLLDAFDPTLIQQLEQIYSKQHPIPCIWQLVSSQLDCDRLDYLMRDSYMTGASYGSLDIDRILLALDYDPASQQLIVQRKGMAAIEHYLIVRYFMYAQVYNHPKNLAATWVLQQAMDRARQQSSLAADDTVTAWLHHVDHLTLEQYLAADDGVFLYHLQRWQQHSDPVLADLCRRFIHRDLLKTQDLTAYSPGEQQTILTAVHQQLEQAGWASQCYAGLRTTVSRGYTLYQRGIQIQTADGLRDISDLSPLVTTLAQDVPRHWLIYPREVDITPSVAAARCTSSKSQI